MSQMLLVPLDGSAFAEQALPLALALARGADSTIDLAMVRANYPLDGERERKYLAGVSHSIEATTDAQVRRTILSDELGVLDPALPTASLTAELLSRHAAANSCDFVVMTTHGRGAVRRIWLGSVADALLRMATCPVVVIRPRDEEFTIAGNTDRGVGHVVVALDGSQASELVLSHAQAIGTPFGAHFTLVRVTSPITWQATGPFAEPIVTTAPPLSREAVHEYLELIAGGMRQFGLSVSTQVLQGNSPAPAIVEYAHAHAADLIALATSGAGSIHRLLLGSVTDKVIRSAEMPVLVCNTRQIAKAATALYVPVAADVMRPDSKLQKDAL
jgi:nucleotide-binding universal stress UspA family protein